MCVICGIIGKHSINSGSPLAQRRQIKIRGNPNVLYNFGNHQVFLKREDAKDELVKRYLCEYFFKLQKLFKVYTF